MSADIKSLTKLARLMIELEAELERDAAAITAKKAALEDIKRIDIPELMREIGVSQIVLEDTGETITVRDDVAASIPAHYREKAFAWLAARGYDGIIRTNLTVEYSRGDHAKAIEDAQMITHTLHRPTSMEEKIHPQTLRAFIRERMAEGETVPADLFGIHAYSEAKIVRAKKA